MELRISRCRLVLLLFVFMTSTVMLYLLRVVDSQPGRSRVIQYRRRLDPGRHALIVRPTNKTLLKQHFKEFVSLYADNDDEEAVDDYYNVLFNKKPSKRKWVQESVKKWKSLDFQDVTYPEDTTIKSQKEPNTDEINDDNTNIWGKSVIKMKPLNTADKSNLLGFPEPLKNKYLIYLCDGTMRCGGWGDRQRGMVGTFILAVVTKRHFGIKMTSPCDLANFYEPNLVNWTVPNDILNDPHAVYIDAIDNSDFKFSLQHLDFNQKYPENVIFLRNNVDFVPALWKNFKYKNNFPKWAQGRYRSARFSKGWKILFKPTWRLQQRYDDVMSQFDTSLARKLVCAHIRIGKNPTIPEDQNQRNPIPSAFVVWHFLSKYIKAPNTRVFIATDADQVRKMAAEEFNADLLRVNGDIRHIDRQRNMTGVCDGFETALLEQMILIDCDVLVTSESGFSILAADIRNSNKELYRLEEGHIIPYKMI